jgi:glycogen operon protein
MDDVDEQGRPITGDTWLILLNAHPSDVGFVLPEAHPGVAWEAVVDTARAGEPGPPERRDVGQNVSLPARSLQLLRASRP